MAPVFCVIWVGFLFTTNVAAWSKLAAYVVVIGLVLELAHRVYWNLNSRLVMAEKRHALSAVGAACAAALPLISVIVVTWLFCSFVDGQPLSSIGLGFEPESLSLFVAGVAVALICIALLFVIGRNVGWFRVERSGISERKLPAFCSGASDFLLAAVFEEIMVRGYVFMVIYSSWGGTAAVFGSAVIFSAFHFIKHPRMPIIFSVNAFLFGIVTGQARLVTGSLWAPMGLHFGWNLAMGPLLGMPCSGRRYENGLVCCAVYGPEWVTGGLYSPDAGLVGTGALLIAAAAVLFLMPI